VSKKSPSITRKGLPLQLPLQRGYLYFLDGKGGLIKPKPRLPADPTDEELLAFFRSCESAKPFRAGAMHYTKRRDSYGVGHKVTDDAELNMYRQALAVSQEVSRKIRRK